MSGRNLVWTTAAAAGLGCAAIAASAAWVLLTQPLAVTSAVAGQDVSALVQALLGALLDAAAALMRML